MRAFIFHFWLLAGYPPSHAEALLKQADLESHLHASAQSPSGHCLYQWTGIRYRRLQHFASSRGCPSLENQLRFAYNELLEKRFSCFKTSKAREALGVLRKTFGRGHSCLSRDSKTINSKKEK